MGIAERFQSALADSSTIKSMADLARATNLNAGTLGKYLPGATQQRSPPLEKCLIIGKALGVSGQWLYDGKGSRKLKHNEAPEPFERNTVQVRLLDGVSAGKLTSPLSQSAVDSLPLLTFADLGRGDFIALTVQGTSMDRLSPEGSIIVVDRADKTLITGKCYVFDHRGETTFKRYQGGETPYLEPVSTDIIHKPIFITKKRDFGVVGRVKRTVLDL